MAERAKPKQKRAPRKTASTSRAGALEKAVERLEAKLQGLRKERDELAGELKRAKTRIKTLEESNSRAVTRIDWVIDSLHNLLEEDK